MEFLFFIIVGVAFVAITIGTSVHRRKTWKEAAATLGLRFDKGGLFGSSGLSGKYDGVAVSIRTVSRGGKNNRKTYTVYEIEPPVVLPPGLQLSGENILSSVGKLFGAQDIQVGLPMLDDAFIIKATRPETARDFLQRPGVEGALLELYNSYPGLKLEDGSLIVENYGFDSAFEMELTLDQLTDAAHQLAGPNQQPPPQPNQPPAADRQSDHPPQNPPPPETSEPADQRPFGRPAESAQPAEPAANNRFDHDNDDWW